MKDLISFFLIYKNNPTKQKDNGDWLVSTAELLWPKNS